MAEAQKKCSKCGDVKSLEEFHKDKSRSDGAGAYCKHCISQQKRNYRARNRGLLTRRTKDWVVHNRDRIAERERKATRILDDRYVKRVLRMHTANRRAEIPPKLIALKREQLAIKRMARELKSALAQTKGATP